MIAATRPADVKRILKRALDNNTGFGEDEYSIRSIAQAAGELADEAEEGGDEEGSGYYYTLGQHICFFNE